MVRSCPENGSNTNRPSGMPAARQADVTGNETVPKTASGATTGGKSKPVYLRMLVKGEEAFALLDSGAEITIIPSDKATGVRLRPTEQKLFAVNNTEIPVRGEADIYADVDGMRVHICGLVTDHITDLILGIDFLDKNDITWSFKEGSIMINDVVMSLHARPGKKRCRRVILGESVSLPPSSESIVSARVVLDGPVRGVLGISKSQWATTTNELRPGVTVAQTLIPQRLDNVPVRVLNLNSSAVSLDAGTVVAELETVDVCDEVDVIPPADRAGERFNVLKSMINGVDGGVPVRDRDELMALLVEYSSAFSLSEEELGRTSVTKHAIDTGGARPVRQRLRRQPPAYQSIVKEHVDSMMKQGIIEPAQSAWAANIVLVKKKDDSYRCCIDYRGLNDVTCKDAYALPRTDVCLDALTGSTWFSTFDMKNSYHQVELEPADAEKTAFICREGMFQFRTMPFGLCNAGATFQRLVDTVLSGLAYEVCLAYIDDIIVFSRSIPEHLVRLRAVLERVRGAGLKLKPKKCFLLQKSVAFLGHVVSGDGISAHPDKVRAVSE